VQCGRGTNHLVVVSAVGELLSPVVPSAAEGIERTVGPQKIRDAGPGGMPGGHPSWIEIQAMEVHDVGGSKPLEQLALQLHRAPEYGRRDKATYSDVHAGGSSGHSIDRLTTVLRGEQLDRMATTGKRRRDLNGHLSRAARGRGDRGHDVDDPHQSP
jgi:hypothetical protein